MHSTRNKHASLVYCWHIGKWPQARRKEGRCCMLTSAVIVIEPILVAVSIAVGEALTEVVVTFGWHRVTVASRSCDRLLITVTLQPLLLTSCGIFLRHVTTSSTSGRVPGCSSRLVQLARNIVEWLTKIDQVTSIRRHPGQAMFITSRFIFLSVEPQCKRLVKFPAKYFWAHETEWTLRQLYVLDVY